MPAFEHGVIDGADARSIDLEELDSRIDHRMSRTRSIAGDDSDGGEILEISRDPHLLRDEDGHPESFYFRYVVRRPDEYTSVDETGADESREYEPKNVVDFLLTVDGEIAYESTGTPEAPLNFLFGEEAPGYTAELPIVQSSLDDHFFESDRVSKISLVLDETEPHGEFTDPSTVPEAVQQLVAVGESVDFSVGHYHRTRDLKQVELVRRMAEKARITKVSATQEGGSSVTLSDAGWAKFNIPEQADSQHRAEILRNRVSVLF